MATKTITHSITLSPDDVRDILIAALKDQFGLDSEMKVDFIITSIPSSDYYDRGPDRKDLTSIVVSGTKEISIGSPKSGPVPR